MTKDNQQNEIIRIQKKRNNFVMMDKGFLEDDRLSFKAKGILAYLLSKPDNWRVYVKDLMRHAKDGRDSVYAGLKELKTYGYFSKTPVRNEKGVVTHWDSVIYEDPSESPENRTAYPFPAFPDTAFPDTAFPDTEKPEHNNNNKNNNYVTHNESSQSQRQTEKPDTTLTTDDDMTLNSESNLSDNEKTKASTLTPISTIYRKAEALNHNVDDYNTYEQLIKEHIEYESFSADNTLVDSLMEIMLDVILTESPDTVKIGKEMKSRNIVKSVYLKLNHEHIEHVIDQFKAQRHKITYKTAYLRTMLYTSYHEVEPHYTNQVRADGVVK